MQRRTSPDREQFHLPNVLPHIYFFMKLSKFCGSSHASKIAADFHELRASPQRGVMTRPFQRQSGWWEKWRAELEKVPVGASSSLQQSLHQRSVHETGLLKGKWWKEDREGGATISMSVQKSFNCFPPDIQFEPIKERFPLKLSAASLDSMYKNILPAASAVFSTCGALKKQGLIPMFQHCSVHRRDPRRQGFSQADKEMYHRFLLKTSFDFFWMTAWLFAYKMSFATCGICLKDGWRSPFQATGEPFGRRHQQTRLRFLSSSAHVVLAPPGSIKKLVNNFYPQSLRVMKSAPALCNFMGNQFALFRPIILSTKRGTWQER